MSFPEDDIVRENSGLLLHYFHELASPMHGVGIRDYPTRMPRGTYSGCRADTSAPEPTVIENQPVSPKGTPFFIFCFQRTSDKATRDLDHRLRLFAGGNYP